MQQKNESRNVAKETEGSMDSLLSTISEICVCFMQRESSQ